MIIKITCHHDKHKELIKKLNTKFNAKLDSINNNRITFTTSKLIYDFNTKDRNAIEAYLESINFITHYDLFADNKDHEKSKKKKHFHIFVDIDSTLTHTGVKTIHHDVKETFRKFREANCEIYFCTGRSYQEVIELNEQYSLGPYGIAEGGGIILGIGKKGYYKFGSREEPDKLIKFMDDNDIDYCIDLDQSPRMTEHVLLRKSITKTDLCRVIKKANCHVDFNTSNNTHHISKKHVDKGEAINYLVGPKELDLDFKLYSTIGVGDSGLDIPMFRMCKDSYAVGNDKKVIAAANHHLCKKAPYAIQELYTILFPHR